VSVAAVVGGSRGIGQAICRRLAADGMRIALMDVRDPGETLAQLPEPAWTHAVDIADPDAIEVAFAALERDWGAPDVLVNVAAICPEVPFLDTTPAIWDETLDVNARGLFFCTQAAARRMRDAGGGRIVNILSTASVQGFANTSAYCASKGAALLITRTTAIELAEYGIAVNGVAPGVVETPLLGAYESNPAIRDHDLPRTPLGRWGMPDDIAEAVAFLVLRARWMTGQVIYVDGGFLATGLPLLPELPRHTDHQEAA
jgi:NAD(P)-dependent dehydrogenase (short-subunit alcohol dehydrogenase family)